MFPQTVRRWLAPAMGVVLIAALGTVAFLTRDRWRPWFEPAHHEDDHNDHGPAASGVSEKVLLSPQAQKNLRVAPKPLKPETFWKNIAVPGVIVDRPGRSDRGVVSPLTGVVTAIHHFPGDLVRFHDLLFTVRILGDSIYTTQTDLFKALQDITLAEQQRKRLASSEGAVAQERVIEVENQIARLNVAAKAYRLDLANRGLSESEIAEVAAGRFVNEIAIRAPLGIAFTWSIFEFQDLKVELGQQVQAGQTLCLLANHQLLAIEGHAFREETPLLERAVRENWSIEVDFQEEESGGWPSWNPPLTIRYLSNTIDPATRTFTFLIPIENQSRPVTRDNHTMMLWRFRPGHQVRLNLRVEKLEDVFVLPVDAVVREGGEAYVFRQNGDTFERKPVHVVHQDRRNVVIANDGSVPAGLYVAQAGAVQMNRMIKAQSGTLPKGFHIHADGSVHMGEH